MKHNVKIFVPVHSHLGNLIMCWQRISQYSLVPRNNRGLNIYPIVAYNAIPKSSELSAQPQVSMGSVYLRYHDDENINGNTTQPHVQPEQT